jgi:hypothetical protein
MHAFLYTFPSESSKVIRKNQKYIHIPVRLLVQECEDELPYLMMINLLFGRGLASVKDTNEDVCAKLCGGLLDVCGGGSWGK